MAAEKRVVEVDRVSDTASSDAGIYSITNTANGKVYVGRALCICRRIAQHRSALRNNKHRNPFLQASWNEHGEAAFQFAVLEFCSLRKRGGRPVRKDVQNLERREYFWIRALSSLKASKGFNIDGYNPPFAYFAVEKLMKSKGLNLDELIESKAQSRWDKQTRLEFEKGLVALLRIESMGPKPRSKAAKAREDASRLEEASRILNEVMSLNLDDLADMNAFHSERRRLSAPDYDWGSRGPTYIIRKARSRY
jgi:group I intron endonuclease